MPLVLIAPEDVSIKIFQFQSGKSQAIEKKVARCFHIAFLHRALTKHKEFMITMQENLRNLSLTLSLILSYSSPDRFLSSHSFYISPLSLYFYLSIELGICI